MDQMNNCGNLLWPGRERAISNYLVMFLSAEL